MEIGTRIKEHRGKLGLSQDDLAQRVYVSRQTISSWENDKTYPDVQSLLILSQVFDTTVDDLIKGDVEAMTKTINDDARTMKRLGLVMTGFLILTLFALAWVAVQSVLWDWDLVQLLPTILLAVVLWGVAMFAAVWSERIKKEHNLVTYREIEAYLAGKPVDRDNPKSERAWKRYRFLEKFARPPHTVRWMA